MADLLHSVTHASPLAVFTGAALLGLTLYLLGAVLRSLFGPAAPQPQGDDGSDPVLPEWTGLLAASLPQLPVELRRIQRDLARAGDYQPFALERFLARRNSVFWLVIMLTLALVGIVPSQSAVVLTLGLLTAAIVYGVPGLYINRRGQARASKLLREIPDMLDVLAMCVSGGLTVEQSLVHMAEHSAASNRELAHELQILARQSLAASPGQAFQRLADRLDEAELRSLAAIVRQAERLGSSLQGAIDELAQSLRKGARQRAEERANSMALKLLFPVIFCVTPPVFFILLVPPIISLRDHFQQDLTKAGGAADPNAAPPIIWDADQ